MTDRREVVDLIFGVSIGAFATAALAATGDMGIFTAAGTVVVFSAFSLGVSLLHDRTRLSRL